MKKEKKRRYLVLIILLLLIIAVVTIVYLNSGASYTSTGTDSTSVIDVGKWAVKVNAADIANSEPLDGLITFAPIDAAGVMPGKMVPGSIAYCDITIDMTGAEVSGNYTVSIDPSAVTLTGFSVLGYENVAVGTPAPTALPASYAGTTTTATGTIAYSTTDPMIATVRVYAEWDPATQYDVSQTAEGVTAGTQNIPVTVTVSQVVPTY